MQHSSTPVSGSGHPASFLLSKECTSPKLPALWFSPAFRLCWQTCSSPDLPSDEQPFCQLPFVWDHPGVPELLINDWMWVGDLFHHLSSAVPWVDSIQHRRALCCRWCSRLMTIFPSIKEALFFSLSLSLSWQVAQEPGYLNSWESLLISSPGLHVYPQREVTSCSNTNFCLWLFYNLLQPEHVHKKKTNKKPACIEAELGSKHNRHLLYENHI